MALSLLAATLVFTMINPAEEIEAKKAEGTKTKSFGQKTMDRVCGDQLCQASQVINKVRVPNVVRQPDVQTQIVSEQSILPFDNAAYDNSILNLQDRLNTGMERARENIEPREEPGTRENVSPRDPARLTQMGWPTLNALPPHASASALIIWNENLQKELISLYDELQTYIGDSEITPDEVEKVQDLQRRLEVMKGKTDQVLSLASSLLESPEWDEEQSSMEERSPRNEHSRIEEINTKQFMKTRAQLQQEQVIMNSMNQITEQLQRSIRTLMPTN